VDELWWGKPDLRKALSGVTKGQGVVLLSHNPDFLLRWFLKPPEGGKG
jgi:hypothetical protein